MLKSHLNRIFIALTLLMIAAAFLASSKRKNTPPPYEERIYVLDSLVVMGRQKPKWKDPNYRISPYDSLIKHYADSVNMDWRFFSAIVYFESKFDPNVKSSRGAAGLMQMMPGTSAKFGAKDPSDPVQSVRAGARYLSMLNKRYIKLAANETEREKLVLAAYNAGEGRIQDCITFARYKGVDPGYWQNIVDLIPEMRVDSIINNVPGVRLGVFKGYETLAYVDRVMEKFEHYKDLTNP